MKLSIIVCSRNEEKTIEQILKKIFKLVLPDLWSKEIIVIDNCSTDNTKEILSNLNHKDMTIIHQKVNLGKGNSVKLGISKATGDFLIPQDSDLEYDPDDIVKLLKYAKANNLEFVIGSRKKNKSRFHKYLINEVGANILTYIFNFLFNSNFTDVASCYKLIRTSKIKDISLKTNGFDLDYEIASKLVKNNISHGEVAINYSSRSFKEGRKSFLKKDNIYMDGMKGLLVMIKVRFFNY
jgi:dolichol-phosphate mannosyltransferase